MNAPLDRDSLLQALDALNAALRRRGVRADVYVFGGAAMVLAYGADRPTRDIDAKFTPHGLGDRRCLTPATSESRPHLRGTCSP